MLLTTILPLARRMAVYEFKSVLCVVIFVVLGAFRVGVACGTSTQNLKVQKLFLAKTKWNNHLYACKLHPKHLVWLRGAPEALFESYPHWERCFWHVLSPKNNKFLTPDGLRQFFFDLGHQNWSIYLLKPSVCQSWPVWRPPWSSCPYAKIGIEPVSTCERGTVNGLTG